MKVTNPTFATKIKQPACLSAAPQTISGDGFVVCAGRGPGAEPLWVRKAGRAEEGLSCRGACSPQGRLSPVLCFDCRIFLGKCKGLGVGKGLSYHLDKPKVSHGVVYAYPAAGRTQLVVGHKPFMPQH